MLMSLVDLLGYIANRKKRLETFKADTTERQARAMTSRIDLSG
jgi:hypothetical protein